jgi:hypothetical protein
MKKHLKNLLLTTALLIGGFAISYGLFTEEGGTSLATWTEEDAGQTTAGRQFLTPVIFSSSVYLPSTANQISGAGSGSGLDADMLDGTHLSSIVASTGSLQTQIDALEVSTGTLQTDLATEVSDRGIADTAIGVATGTLRTDITALGVSTGSLLTTIQSIQTDTTTLQSLIDTLETDTSTLAGLIDQLELDTATLSTDKLSKTDTFGGDVSGTYDALQVNSIRGIDIATSTFVIDEFWVNKGTYTTTSAAGAGDAILSADQEFTGANTFSGGINITAQSTFTANTSFSGTNTHTGLETFDRIAISSAMGEGTPVANTLYKDNIIKGWISLNGTGVIAIKASFNVTSISDGGTGDITITWDVDFADANYAIAGMCGDDYISQAEVNTGTLRIITKNDAGTATDSGLVTVIAVGSQ